MTCDNHRFNVYGKPQERCVVCSEENPIVTQYRQKLMVAMEHNIDPQSDAYPRHPFLTEKNARGDVLWKHKDMKRYFSMRRK